MNRLVELPRPARLHVTDRSVVVDRELFTGLLGLLVDLIDDRRSGGGAALFHDDAIVVVSVRPTAAACARRRVTTETILVILGGVKFPSRGAEGRA
jgi:hypothetical protein